MSTLSPILLLIPLGLPELMLIFLVVIVLFGASRIPQIGRGLGEGIRNFKKGIRETSVEDEEPERIEEKRATRP
jgi:sec-independent protein translocase protein TatA